MKRTLFFLFLLSAPGLALADPISAIASIGSAISGAAAGMTLVSGLTTMGTVLGVAGLVTGNKKLAKLGGILGLAGGITSLIRSGLSTASGAGAAQLAQTTTPIEQVAQEASAAAAGGSAGAEALTAAQNAGLGTDDLVATAAKSAESAVDPVKTAIEKTATTTQPPGSDGSLLGRLAEGIKKNKELVQLGAGLVSGAASGYQQRALRQDEEAAIRRRQQRYSDSVRGVAPMGQFVNPNADVTSVTPRDPMRFVPRRGLVNGRA